MKKLFIRTGATLVAICGIIAATACASSTAGSVAAGVGAAIQAAETANAAYCALTEAQRQAVRDRISGGRQLLCPVDKGNLPAPSS